MPERFLIRWAGESEGIIPYGNETEVEDAFKQNPHFESLVPHAKDFFSEIRQIKG